MSECKSSWSKRSRIDSTLPVPYKSPMNQQANQLLGFVPYYLKNDSGQFKYCKSSVRSTHNKLASNNTTKDLILTKHACNLLVYGYFRLCCGAHNVKISIRDLANIILKYFEGNAFEINLYDNLEFATMFFEPIALNSNMSMVSMPSRRVTLNLTLNHCCDFDAATGDYSNVIGLIGYKKDSHLSNSKFFGALDEWQQMQMCSLNKIDYKTNPFSDLGWHKSPVMNKNGFNIDNICLYYFELHYFSLLNKRKWNMYEILPSNKSMIKKDATCDINWGDTVSATIDNLTNSLTITARIGEDSCETTHTLHECDLLPNMNYIFVTTITSCGCEDLNSAKGIGMDYQISMEASK